MFGAGGERLDISRLDGIFGRDLELTGELPRGVVSVPELAGEAGVEPEPEVAGLSTEEEEIIWNCAGLRVTSGTARTLRILYLIPLLFCEVGNKVLMFE